MTVSTEFSSKYFSLISLAEGVWAALSIPGTGSWSNAGIIDMGDQTIIFDAFATPTAAQDLRIAAEKLTGRQATIVLNSHYHLDHVSGNQVFQDVPIMSTKLTREQIAIQQPRLIEIFKNNPEYLDQVKAELEQEESYQKRQELEDLLGEYSMILKDTERFKLTLPTITFEDTITLNGARMYAEFTTYGGGHTCSDSFLYLPKEQVIFLADLMHIGYHADFRQGNVDQWINILERVKKLKIKTIVSGHGGIGTAEELDKMIDYLNTLKQISVDWVQHEGTIENIDEIDIPKRYASYGAPSIFHYNIKSLLEKGI
ncbi:MBL fold metallo-hydrolase [Sporolactobacillus laevolacticus]|uniref:MBL fold metallo-hydrolase n=1 Tax=Sporolactobacillus laevolacticus TaxID=33018 RepID=UPI0025B35227|nr:MBL fold metallo-hydrolase [Sporolactobacillus laevolacticus]MDN3955825.1 MBL fold metallo-hydrolase [Sporolactobacillus laevolacticus]